MLEQYSVKPQTVDQIRAAWIGEPVEKDVAWLRERGYAPRTVLSRVPILMGFGKFATDPSATTWEELPELVDPFVSEWIAKRGSRKASAARRNSFAKEVRGPVDQMLRVVVPGHLGPAPPNRSGTAPRFLEHLREEKGLKESTLKAYRYHLRAFAAYLQDIGLTDLAHLSPAVLSAFVADYGARVDWASLRNCCGELHVFLRYLYREGVLTRDQSGAVEPPQTFRFSGFSAPDFLGQ